MESQEIRNPNSYKIILKAIKDDPVKNQALAQIVLENKEIEQFDKQIELLEEKITRRKEKI